MSSLTTDEHAALLFVLAEDDDDPDSDHPVFGQVERIIDRRLADVADKIVATTLPGEIWYAPRVKAWFVQGINFAVKIIRSEA